MLKYIDSVKVVHTIIFFAAYVKPTTGEKVWYVFTPRNRKYRNGDRPNRAAGNGFWKATGADKAIKDDKNSIIGLRKALVYYNGKPTKAKKTDWIMHEYRVPGIRDISKRHAKDLKVINYLNYFLNFTFYIFTQSGHLKIVYNL